MTSANVPPAAGGSAGSPPAVAGRTASTVLDIGAATVIGAALRAERRGLSEGERKAFARRLAALATTGDPAAALVWRRLAETASRL